jgi:hypothetical protein
MFAHLYWIAFVTAVAAYVPMTAEAGCRIFEKPDYGGAGYSLDNGERMIMVDLGCSSSHGDDNCPIYEGSWNDKVSSFKVSKGCTLTLWEHINQGGARFRSNSSYRYVGDNWNNLASEALCSCK